MALENDSNVICSSWLTNHVQKIEESTDDDFKFDNIALQIVKQMLLASVVANQLFLSHCTIVDITMMVL